MKEPAPGGKPGRAVERSDTSKSTAPDAGNPVHSFAEQLERISAADRQYFEQHPRSRWRIRPTEPGEWPAEVQGSRWTAVRSIGIGRVRIPLTGSPPPGLTDRGIDRLMGVIMPAQTKRMIAEIEAIAKEAGR